jgi:hypothetical protein
MLIHLYPLVGSADAETCKGSKLPSAEFAQYHLSAHRRLANSSWSLPPECPEQAGRAVGL